MLLRVTHLDRVGAVAYTVLEAADGLVVLAVKEVDLGEAKVCRCKVLELLDGAVVVALRARVIAPGVFDAA